MTCENNCISIQQTQTMKEQDMFAAVIQKYSITFKDPF